MRLAKIFILSVMLSALLVPNTLACGGPRQPAFVETEGSIALVRVLTVLDRGDPNTLKPIILRVRSVRVLRKVGSGLPQEFILRRHPKASKYNAIPDVDHVAEVVLVPVPSVGELQFVAARRSESGSHFEEVAREIPYSAEAEARLKSGIGRLSGVRANFFAESLRLDALKK